VAIKAKIEAVEGMHEAADPCWVLVDKDEINVTSIIVYGVLEFVNSSTVTANHILVQVEEW